MEENHGKFGSEEILFLLDRMTELKNKNVENFVDFIENLEILMENEINVLAEQFGELDGIHLLSLMESLAKLSLTRNMKIWIKLEAVVLKTQFLNLINIDFFPLIAESFQIFFEISDSTINVEEIFEEIELKAILRFENNNDLENLSLDKAIHLFVVFAKNLEGSKDFYEHLLKKFLSAKNLSRILNDKENSAVLLFATNLIEKSVYKSKNLKVFKNLLESQINSVKFENGSKIDGFLNKIIKI